MARVRILLKSKNTQRGMCNFMIATTQKKTKRVNQLWEWAPVTGDGVLISEWATFGGKLWKPTTSLNGTMALAAASIAGVFAAAIFIGLRLRRPAAVQQPMLDLE